MRLVVVCPHLRPDTAPTGTVMSEIVDQLVARGHEVHVVTSLPWYRHHRGARAVGIDHSCAPVPGW
jgi:colanic acid biosynthesis glycosyl transferase WcaI